MPEAQTQQWRGTPKGGAKMQHRRMQSTGIAYPAITPFMSPQLPFASDRRVGSSSVGMHTRSSSSLSYASLLGTSTASQDAMPNRSPLLEEFRALHNRGKTYELKDIRGAVVEFSTDQHGSRFTQDRLIGATREMIEMVFDEILPAVEMLMVDVFGNYVVQKIIEHGTPEMRQTLLERMKDKTRELSFSTYGCRVVQRMLDCVDQPGRMQIANEVKDHVETFVCDQNANHVVQKILERSTPISDVDFISHVFRGNVKRLASHCYSCRVLQRIFEYCEDSEKRPLMVEMLGVIGDLMKDRYGNYVVQWVLREGQSQDKHDVIASIKGDVLALSTAKCASNVVEKAIECSSPQDRFDLIEEIMRPIHGDDDGQYTPLVLDLMMKDQYGNYVLQCCINHASEEQRRRLLAVSQRALIRLKHASGSGSNARHLNAIQRLLDAKGTS
jgi:pumilio RNA-binding family